MSSGGLARLKAIGPGALATAAFIGPGTVTTATIAGATFGPALLWALVFATIAAIVLHEMAARLGVVSGRGLGAAIVEATKAAPPLRLGLTLLIISALLIGNAAYEGGNLAGAALGAQALAPDAPPSLIVTIIIAIAAALLFLGGYKLIERVLIGAVLLMSGCFLAAFIAVKPDLSTLATGLVPSIPPGAVMLAVGLIGTTIVPYNLFLHAAAARTRWAQSPAHGPDARAAALSDARFDLSASIGLGGLISILILSTAAMSLFGATANSGVNNAADMARQLEPAFGAWAKYVIAGGLLAAGLSSAVTAPLASGYAAAELFGFPPEVKNLRFRLVAGAVLACGAAAALSGARPVSIILFAQFANGLLLPIIAGFLIYAANNKALLGVHVNNARGNIIAGLVLLLTTLIGGRGLYAVLTSL